jgi:hypothetical protein
MQEIVIVRSTTSIQTEGSQSSDPGYAHSHHKNDVKLVESALKEANLQYIYWNENQVEANLSLAKKPGTKIMVVPALRVCSEITFQRMLDYARQGWIIFATIDSFFYAPTRDISERKISTRLKELFGLGGSDFVESIETTSLNLNFPKTPYSWLTQGLMHDLTLKGSWVVGIRGTSRLLTTHGEIELVDVKTGNKSTWPAFAIYEHESGGMFIYSCFSALKISSRRTIFKNMQSHQNQTPEHSGQLRALRWTVVFLVVVIALFIADKFITVEIPWMKEIGAALIGGILGWIITKIMDYAEKFLKDK